MGDGEQGHLGAAQERLAHGGEQVAAELLVGERAQERGCFLQQLLAWLNLPAQAHLENGKLRP